jgi:hypothetical protein
MGCSSLWWLLVERLNPHPSHETKARRVRHPEKPGVYLGGVEGLATRRPIQRLARRADDAAADRARWRRRNWKTRGKGAAKGMPVRGIDFVSEPFGPRHGQAHPPPFRRLHALSTMKKQITNRKTDDKSSHHREAPLPASTQATATRNVGNTQRAHRPNST